MDEGSDRSWKMQDELAATLAEMHTRFGDGAFTSRRRLLSLLADRMPGANREIKVLALALEDGAVETLAGAGVRLPIEIDRLCAAMEMRHGTRSDIARPVLLALAHGLGLAPSASRTGGDGEWIGASSIVATAGQEQQQIVREMHQVKVPAAAPRRNVPMILLIAAGVIVLLVAILGIAAAMRPEVNVDLGPDPKPGPRPVPPIPPKIITPPPIPLVVPPVPKTEIGVTPPPLPKP